MLRSVSFRRAAICWYSGGTTQKSRIFHNTVGISRETSVCNINAMVNTTKGLSRLRRATCRLFSSMPVGDSNRHHVADSVPELAPASTFNGLPSSALARACDPHQFDFDTTAELGSLIDFVGQQRAVDAFNFGLRLQGKGYNLIVLGRPGTGRSSVAKSLLQRRANEEPPPLDIVLLNNFNDTHTPTTVLLPPGMGSRLKKAMATAISDIMAGLQDTMDSDQIRLEREQLAEETRVAGERATSVLRSELSSEGYILEEIEHGGWRLTRLDNEGRALTNAALEALPLSQQEEISLRLRAIQRRVLESDNRLLRDYRDRLRVAEQTHAAAVIQPIMSSLKEKFCNNGGQGMPSEDAATTTRTGTLKDRVEPQTGSQAEHRQFASPFIGLEQLESYFQLVERDIYDFLPQFVSQQVTSHVTYGENRESSGGGGSADHNGGAPSSALSTNKRSKDALQRYDVNVLVTTQTGRQGAPVVVEDNPTVANLVGTVDSRTLFGSIETDFTLVRPGSLHRANGGYLLLDAQKLLMQPVAWHALKRALSTQMLRLESQHNLEHGLSSSVAMTPTAMPLNVKVVLISHRDMFQQLKAFDAECEELFRVTVDFDESMQWHLGSSLEYALLIAKLVRTHDLRHFDKPAVARVIEAGARICSDQRRLSVEMRKIQDIVREADFWSGQSGRQVVSSVDVDRALREADYRAGRVRSMMQESIANGQHLINTSGSYIGQVNALSLMTAVVGKTTTFGLPTRLTAVTYPGPGDVIDIEREAALGGPIHTKGMFIMQGLLASRYGHDHPLSLRASIVFEQSYTLIDGDSASLAEFIAVVSSISGVAVTQSIAVTGSINQIGEVQAVGSVNEKIEGFFDVCFPKVRSNVHRWGTSLHVQPRAEDHGCVYGVVIPASNSCNLMLDRAVIDACERGIFKVYTVSNVDEAIEILFDASAGEQDAVTKQYPPNTVNGLTSQRLMTMWQKSRGVSISTHDVDNVPQSVPRFRDHGNDAGDPKEGGFVNQEQGCHNTFA